MSQSPDWRAHMHPHLLFWPCSSGSFSSLRSAISSSSFSFLTRRSASRTDLTSPLTPVSLLKLGAPVITMLSSTQPLNAPHSHSASLFPLSSWPSVKQTIQHQLHEYCRGGVMFGMPSGFYPCVIGKRRAGLMAHVACCD